MMCELLFFFRLVARKLTVVAIIMISTHGEEEPSAEAPEVLADGMVWPEPVWFLRKRSQLSRRDSTAERRPERDTSVVKN